MNECLVKLGPKHLNSSSSRKPGKDALSTKAMRGVSGRAMPAGARALPGLRSHRCCAITCSAKALPSAEASLPLEKPLEKQAKELEKNLKEPLIVEQSPARNCFFRSLRVLKPLETS